MDLSLAFITGNNSLELLLEGLLAQIHIELSWRGFRPELNRVHADNPNLLSPALFSSYGNRFITKDPSGPSLHRPSSKSTKLMYEVMKAAMIISQTKQNTLQHTVTLCNTDTATRARHDSCTWHAIQHSTTMKLQHTARRCNTLQHAGLYARQHIWRQM